MPADETFPLHPEPVGKKDNGHSNHRQKDKKYGNMDISDPSESDRKPRNDPNSDEVDPDNEQCQGAVKKLMRELDTDTERLSPKEGKKDKNIPYKKGPYLDNIQTGVDAVEKNGLTVGEQVNREDPPDAKEHELRLPAHMAGGMAECPLQVHEDHHR